MAKSENFEILLGDEYFLDNDADSQFLTRSVTLASGSSLPSNGIYFDTKTKYLFG